MKTTTVEVSVKGRAARMPLLLIKDRRIVCGGEWLKVAQVHDEQWLEEEAVDDPEEFVSALRRSGFKADVFTFGQALPATAPKYHYHLEWDNLAVASTNDYSSWWEGLPQESRKNVRRAERRGLVVKAVDFNDELARGIKDIYDETPVRQGRRFWHFGKDLETVKRENSSYLERSQFIGTYYNDELIGFLKMVYVAHVARIMQIVAKNQHVDKRPTNALLAKAVEQCSQKSVDHLIYGQFVYGKKHNSPVTEFKRRNGFYQVLMPRYYIPLSLKGRIAVAAGLHRGAKHLLPESMLSFLLAMRQSFYQRFLFHSKVVPSSTVRPQ